MARTEDNDSPKGVLTQDGLFKANNFLYDLLRPRGNGREGYRKNVVSFIRDPETGHLKEVSTGKLCEVQYLNRDRKQKFD